MRRFAFAAALAAAGCAPAPGEEGVMPPSLDVEGALPPVETRCAAYATGLTLLASLSEVDEGSERRANLLLGFGTLAGCSDPAWERAVSAWNAAVEERG